MRFGGVGVFLYFRYEGEYIFVLVLPPESFAMEVTEVMIFSQKFCARVV